MTALSYVAKSQFWGMPEFPGERKTDEKAEREKEKSDNVKSSKIYGSFDFHSTSFGFRLLYQIFFLFRAN